MKNRCLNGMWPTKAWQKKTNHKMVSSEFEYGFFFCSEKCIHDISFALVYVFPIFALCDLFGAKHSEEFDNFST